MWRVWQKPITFGNSGIPLWRSENYTEIWRMEEQKKITQVNWKRGAFHTRWIPGWGGHTDSPSRPPVRKDLILQPPAVLTTSSGIASVAGRMWPLLKVKFSLYMQANSDGPFLFHSYPHSWLRLSGLHHSLILPCLNPAPAPSLPWVLISRTLPNKHPEH